MFNLFKSKKTDHLKISKKDFEFLKNAILNSSKIEVIEYYKQDPMSFIDISKINQIGKETGCVSVKINYDKLRFKYNATFYRFKINDKLFDIFYQSGNFTLSEVDVDMVNSPIRNHIHPILGYHTGGIIMEGNSLTERMFFDIIETKWFSEHLKFIECSVEYGVNQNSIINLKNNEPLAYYL